MYNYMAASHSLTLVGCGTQLPYNYIYTHMYMCTLYTWSHTHVPKCVRTYVHMYTYICTYAKMCVDICTSVHVYISTCITYVHISRMSKCAWTYAHTYICIHVHLCGFICSGRHVLHRTDAPALQRHHHWPSGAGVVGRRTVLRCVAGEMANVCCCVLTPFVCPRTPTLIFQCTPPQPSIEHMCINTFNRSTYGPFISRNHFLWRNHFFSRIVPVLYLLWCFGISDLDEYSLKIIVYLFNILMYFILPFSLTPGSPTSILDGPWDFFPGGRLLVDCIHGGGKKCWENSRRDFFWILTASLGIFGRSLKVISREFYYHQHFHFFYYFAKSVPIIDMCEYQKYTNVRSILSTSDFLR